ncbi:NF038105 family protein [Acinetobacter ursingii]|uniref:NF038105 family protein n=1 Tax=Acinetobacter ursingii TaxID=108980 RepID=UPI00124CBA8E|nr:NF038105 family protein [Acinetobacter ursingii]
MTTKTFGAMPTPNEAISLDEISKESVDEEWKGYEAKPEYKEFNKHDLIESMHPPKAEQEQQSP